MSENKTKATNVSVDSFIAGIENERQREESKVLVKLLKDVTKLEPLMWGPTMIGFGDYHYEYESGRTGDMFKVGFAPRTGKFALYGIENFEKYRDLFSKLGKHEKSKACVYVKRLEDIDMDVLRELFEKHFKD